MAPEREDSDSAIGESDTEDTDTVNNSDKSNKGKPGNTAGRCKNEWTKLSYVAKINGEITTYNR